MTKTIKKGFTIIELLIVIVVIGILAGIVTVTYNGIQDRAKTTAASTAAKEVGDKAKVFYAEQSAYPTSAELIAAQAAGGVDVPTAKLTKETSDKVKPAAPTSSTKTDIGYQLCNASGDVTDANKADATGVKVSYWDYQGKAAKTITVGDC